MRRGVFIYVSIVAWFFPNAKNIIKNENDFLIPIFMLLLFIVSASVTGFLVLEKPISLYLSNYKKEAFFLLFATLGWLILFILTIMTTLSL